MSRIGKKIIQIPEGTTVDYKDFVITATGPLGKLELEIPDKIRLKIDEKTIEVTRATNDKEIRALHGTFRQLIANNLEGVSKGFEKTLEIVGVGYRVAMEGPEIVIHIGYSHPVRVTVPDDLKAKTEKNKIIVSGIDKQRVGQFSAELRQIRKPEPYKGKGIRYAGEKIRLKAGKAAKGSK
jgi:large subunit ribosomal protein L6